MVQCMWGTDNESAFSILGCYANWTVSGLPSPSGLAVPPLLCVTLALCSCVTCACAQWGASSCFHHEFPVSIFSVLWCTYRGPWITQRTAAFVLCCMYVVRKLTSATPCACVLVGGGLDTVLASPRIIPPGGAWVAIFPTRQILGPSVRPHHPQPGNTAEHSFWPSCG